MPSRYFERVESLLRRSIGVSLTAKPDTSVRPAPPTAHGPLPEGGVTSDDDQGLGDQMPEAEKGKAADWADWSQIKKQMDEEKEREALEHDEL